MPTLLDLCDIDIPPSVEGLSMVGSKKRDWLYCEVGEDLHASRMVTDGTHKLIYYPVGNVLQMFDTRKDPGELDDLSEDDRFATMKLRLTKILISQLYGGDESWAEGDRLKGLASQRFEPGGNRSLSAQRGSHWPPPPQMNIPQIDWNPVKSAG
jgi:hypothetical protein